jgi:hypothetical protein
MTTNTHCRLTSTTTSSRSHWVFGEHLSHVHLHQFSFHMCFERLKRLMPIVMLRSHIRRNTAYEHYAYLQIFKFGHRRRGICGVRGRDLNVSI